jgi:glycosyltransferase involved in cell wall biosynthesis
VSGLLRILMQDSSRASRRARCRVSLLRLGSFADMRLAIYIRSVESARGAERVAVNVARGLAERGHDIDFLVEEDRAWLIGELVTQHTNVSLVDLRGAGGGFFDGLFRGWAFLAHLATAPRALITSGDACIGPVARVLFKDRPPIRALHRYLRRVRPQAVLSFLNYPNVVLLLTARLCPAETRFVVSVRNHMSVAAANNESRWVRSVPRLMRRLFRLADAIVAPSRGVADDVVRITGLAGDRISLVYNPVFRPELAALAEAQIDHPWLADGNEPVVLGVGKFKRQKDFPTLLRAFAQVRARRPARLIILGEGEDAPKLKALAESLRIADDVDFPGHVQNPFAFYGRAAVFVLSSLWEGLPNALIEALACGCPVVSTDCPSGPSEILDGGRFGALVPVGSATEMAGAILATLGDPPSRMQLIERAREFSLDQAVRRFEAVLAG